MTHVEFLRDRFGSANWVLARRTPNILRRYGDDVVCISKKQYAAVEKEWRYLYGDPYDKARAELYCVLRDLRDCLPLSSITSDPFRDRIDAALEAERNAR